MNRRYALVLSHCLAALAGQVLIVASFWGHGFPNVLTWPPAVLILLSPLPEIADGLLMTGLLAGVIVIIHSRTDETAIAPDVGPPEQPGEPRSTGSTRDIKQGESRDWDDGGDN